MNKQCSNIWGDGHLFAFSAIDGVTDYENGLILRSTNTPCTLELKAPEQGGVIYINKTAPTKTELAGDFFTLEFNDKIVKGVILDIYHILIQGTCQIFGQADCFYYEQKENLTLLGIKKFFNSKLLDSNFEEIYNQRASWLNSIEISDKIQNPQALFKACSQLKTQINSPEGIIKHTWTTPDRWPHKNMWLWDSVFHAIGLRHLDLQIAKDSLLAVFDVQTDDGFIPLMAKPDLITKVTQPPILGYGIDKLLEKGLDLEFLKIVYPKNGAFLNWISKNRDVNSNGLVEWYVENYQNCRCGESGMDNSPRFDHTLLLDAVDFNAFLSHEYELMAKFAELLNLPEDVKLWENKHKKLNELINSYLWNEELGLYVDFDSQENKQSLVMASAGFLPLLCGATNKEQTEKLLAHLHNKETFGTPFIIPSISASDVKSYQKDMWRGPVWININYLIADGFEKNGQIEEAKRIRQMTINEIEKHYNNSGVFFEFYDDKCELEPQFLNRKGTCNPKLSPMHQAFMDYGWSATLYIDLVLNLEK